MKTKFKILSAALVFLLLAAGLISGCSEPGENCRGSGECTITIMQNPNGSGLIRDIEADWTDCADYAQWDETINIAGDWTGGCKVANYNDSGPYKDNRKSGTHKCDC